METGTLLLLLLLPLPLLLIPSYFSVDFSLLITALFLLFSFFFFFPVHLLLDYFLLLPFFARSFISFLGRRQIKLQ